jgi:hypothetical protein
MQKYKYHSVREQGWQQKASNSGPVPELVNDNVAILQTMVRKVKYVDMNYVLCKNQPQFSG